MKRIIDAIAVLLGRKIALTWDELENHCIGFSIYNMKIDDVKIDRSPSPFWGVSPGVKPNGASEVSADSGQWQNGCR